MTFSLRILAILPATVSATQFGRAGSICRFLSDSFILGMANKFLNPTVLPHVRAAYKAMIDYGEETPDGWAPCNSITKQWRPGTPTFWRAGACPIRYPGGYPEGKVSFSHVSAAGKILTAMEKVTP
jgi:hypothetical protein